MKPCPDCTNTENPGRYVSLFSNVACPTCDGTKEVSSIIDKFIDVKVTLDTAPNFSRSSIRSVGGQPMLQHGSSLHAINENTYHVGGFDSYEEFRKAVCPIDVQVPIAAHDAPNSLYSRNLLWSLYGLNVGTWPKEIYSSYYPALPDIFKELGDIL